MHYQYVPFVWLLIVSASITLFLAIYALLRRRHAKGAVTFALTMIMMTAWSVIYAFCFSSADLPTKIFWNNMMYIPASFTPVLFLALNMLFTGHDDWVYSKKILWFTVLPAIFCIIKWTDVQYGLILNNMHMDYMGTRQIMVAELGPVCYIDVVYTLSLNLASIILLIRGLFLKNTIYRRQSLALLTALVLPNVPYLLFLFVNSSIFKTLDITILSFGPTGLILAWGIFRFKLFDLLPVARATVIETMDAGVMVLDLQERIIDINPAFQKILGLPAALISGRNVEDVCRNLPVLTAACKDWNVTETEFSINEQNASRDCQLLISPLNDNRGKLMGRLAISYDITEKKQAQQEYLKQQWRLAVIEERERMARDLHDNLGQVLGFINLQTQGIRQELSNAGVNIASQRLDKLLDVSQSAHNEIREYIQHTRSLAFTEKDFIAALTRELSVLEKQSGLKVSMDIPAGFTGEEMEANTKINILNIIKEALNNAAKHAQAQHVKISFALAPEYLCAAIEDDGKGFDIIHNKKDSMGKFGLSIMRERADEIGAQIDILSETGQGSRVVLKVPMKKEVEF